MKLNNLLLITVLGVLILPVNAQKKFNAGIQAGYSYNMPSQTDTVTQKLPGFHFGPIFSYHFSDMFGFESGLLFDYFDGKTDSKKVLSNWTRTHTTAYYLNLPIRFKYTANAADDLYASALIGPNLNYGLKKVTDTEIFKDEKIIPALTQKGTNIYENPALYQAFDLQFGIGVSIQYLQFAARASYDFGLLDRLKNDKTIRTKDFKIGIAYIF